MAMAVSDIAVGKKIRFKINSANDNVYHNGTVISLGSYSVASSFSDVVSAYRDLKLSGAGVIDVEKDIYVILEYVNSVGVSQKTAYGMSWINAATLELVAENTHADIRIYDLTRQDTDEVIDYIKSLGYSADVRSYPTK